MTEKIDKETALARIKTMIGKYYEDIGREVIDDSEGAKQELIDSVDELLNNVEISAKHLVIEKLQLDNEVNKLLKKEWTNEK